MKLFLQPHLSLSTSHLRTVAPATARRKAKNLLPVTAGLLLAVTAGYAASATPADGKISVDDGTFKCMTDMVKVRHFYVDNLLAMRRQRSQRRVAVTIRPVRSCSSFPAR